MRRRTPAHVLGAWPALLAASALVACGVDQGVASESAAQLGEPPTEATVPDATDPPDTGPETDDTEPDTTAPPPPTIDEADPTTTVDRTAGEVVPIDEVVNVGSNKPSRDYDPFVGTALDDIQRWWAEIYPEIYGEPYVPLAGGIYAAYPERTEPIPGCGQPETTYPEVHQFAAFYCADGDFMVYDDGPESILGELAGEFGDSIMGVVLAHEFGHAIQFRSGVLQRDLPTIYGEQQADCFAGAWTARAYNGEAPNLQLDDADVRSGLIAMVTVRDPTGLNQFVEGGHGSAFDRVGAFQEGFIEGPARCAELIDDPLPLVPNEFVSDTDAFLEGNAPYDCVGLDPDTCSPAREFLSEDLNAFWASVIGGEGQFPPIEVVPTVDLGDVDCGEPTVIANAAIFCADTRQVFYDEPAILELYEAFGDFALGYFLGISWAEAGQQALGSELDGEERALVNDCFTGAWVRNITPPGPGQLPPSGRDVTSSPGDLDEAIRTAILIGDERADDDGIGSAFEKIDNLRDGVLGGIESCTERIPG